MRHINRYPRQGMRLTLMLLPFVLMIAAWFIGSAVRLEANPQDKLLPGLSQMIAAIDRMAFTPDKRSGEYLLWADTLISMSRLLIGLALSSLMTVVSMIPPLAILPVLFIVFGLDELSKVMLIVIGITPMLARDLEQRAREIPAELFIKAQTLGANSWTVVLRVVLPQLLSRLITSLRLLLGSAWLFLISAEAISATAGLGYRIFLVRRYMAMDVIIPYVIWITLLAWLMDLALRQLHKACFPWAEGGRA
ncbi:TPA: ABC transporter permease [Klebsiella michiganensis]